MSPTTSVRKNPRKKLPPRNTPDSFCRRFTRQNHRCAAWAVFFFSGNLSGQSPSILLCKTVPLLKKPLGLSLLRYACKRKPYLENFMSRPNVIPTFRQRRCTNRGRNFVRSKRCPTYMSSTTSTYFYALTIRKQLPGNDFERSGRGQEPSRGHKFSILENFLSIRDFTSAMHLHFRSDLVGACLPQTLLIIRALRHEWNGVSCLHNFTEELSNRQEVQ